MNIRTFYDQLAARPTNVAQIPAEEWTAGSYRFTRGQVADTLGLSLPARPTMSQRTEYNAAIQHMVVRGWLRTSDRGEHFYFTIVGIEQYRAASTTPTLSPTTKSTAISF
mgnify:CR=1 FL=1